MKFKANHWIKYDGVWRRAGEIFRINEADADMMKEHGEVLEGPDEPVPEEQLPEPEIVEPEETVKRGRKRKNAE